MKITWGNKISKTMLLEGTTKGKNNPAYIDGRTNKKYHCKNCNKLISYQSALYSQGLCRSCAKKIQVKGKNNPNFKYGETLKKHYCIDCSKLLKDYKAKRCKKCFYLWRKRTGQFKGENNPMYGKKGKLAGNYIDGRSLEIYPSEYTPYLRKRIRERDDFTCQNCGMIEEEHLIVIGQTLEVHHIDYNKQNCKEENLITLCCQCNIRANYNKKYWQNYFENKILKKVL